MDLIGRNTNKYVEHRTRYPRAVKNKYGDKSKTDFIQVGYSYYVNFTNRKDWGAAVARKSTGYFCLPVTHVRLLTTRSDYCDSKESCSSVLQKLQTYHMNNGLCDIPHNFMIGGDNTVYEGRGFIWNPLLKEEYGELDGKVLDIAFIGTFLDRDPSSDLFTVALDLIKACILRKTLVSKFELISFPEIRQPALPL